MAPRNTKDGARRAAKKEVENGQENVYDDEDYRKRRERNNEAVKKSRVKSKIRTQQTLERAHKLKTENEMLEEKIKILSQELDYLKEAFFAHAGTANAANMDTSQIELLLKTSSEETADTLSSSSRRGRKPSLEGRRLH